MLFYPSFTVIVLKKSILPANQIKYLEMNYSEFLVRQKLFKNTILN